MSGEVFDRDERKAINSMIKSIMQGKKDVFDLVNRINQQNAVNDKHLVYDLIEKLLAEQEANKKPVLQLAEQPKPFNVEGRKLIAQNAIDDMTAVMRMPFVMQGSAQADAHRVKENSVPVGGVVITEDVVYPGIVGNDIACSVLYSALPVQANESWFDDTRVKSVKYVLENFSYFGRKENPDSQVFWNQSFAHDEMILESDLGKQVWNTVKAIATRAFGTSGDGNHFVEFGFTNLKYNPATNQWVSTDTTYLALLSHFGSRGVGSTIAKVFGNYAKSNYEMPKGFWDAPLPLDTPEGQDYWKLMNWAGEFAEAGHYWLHQWLLDNLSERLKESLNIDGQIYSKHNFAWKQSDGTIIHRKGATPAENGVYGVIPATMGDKTQIVLGLGNPKTLNSASHGAGRRYSRRQAIQQFGSVDTADHLLREYGVTLIGGGPDEHPEAYKKIREVMTAQQDSVQSLGYFRPIVVRMAPPR
jgi:tRNA-splicing ligase RtcB (3'-phosphate/5'-hydroxy nucleic acid ligase)